MNKDSRILELILEVVNKKGEIRISEDFRDMLTVSVENEDGDHEHIGYPGNSLKHLEKEFINWLSRQLEDV